MSAATAWSVPLVAMLAAPGGAAQAPSADELRALDALAGSTRIVRVTVDGHRYDAVGSHLGPEGLTYGSITGGAGRAAIVTTVETPAAPASPIPWSRIERLETSRSAIHTGMKAGVVLGVIGGLMGYGVSGLAEMEGDDVNNAAFAVVGALVPFGVATAIGAAGRHHTTIYDAAVRPVRDLPGDSQAEDALERMVHGSDHLLVATGDGVYRVSEFEIAGEGLRFGETKVDRARPAVAHGAPAPPAALQSPVPGDRIQTIERPRGQVGRGAAIGLAVGAVAMIPTAIVMAQGDVDRETAVATTTAVIGVPTLVGALIGARGPRYEVVYRRDGR